MSPGASAQGSGSIRGLITDPSSAVIPGATVVAVGNGATHTAKTDGQGRYTVPNLPAGSYTLRAEVLALRADADGAMKPGLSSDGVHPTPQGYAIMAPLAEAGIAQAIGK